MPIVAMTKTSAAPEGRAANMAVKKADAKTPEEIHINTGRPTQRPRRHPVQRNITVRILPHKNAAH
jgi:hypothetical protein